MNVLWWKNRGDEGLGNKVSLYIPSTRDVNKALDPKEHETFVREAATFLAERFGGASSYAVQGYWVASDGTLVTEKSTIVYAAAKSLSSTDREAVFSYARDLRARLTQEAVMVEVNGRVYFV